MNATKWNSLNIVLVLLNFGCYVFFGTWYNYVSMFVVIECMLYTYMMRHNYEETLIKIRADWEKLWQQRP